MTNKQLLNLVSVFSNTPDEPNLVPYSELKPKRLIEGNGDSQISIEGVDPDLLNQYIFIRQLGPTCSITNLASVINTLRSRQGLAPFIHGYWLIISRKMEN